MTLNFQIKNNIFHFVNLKQKYDDLKIDRVAGDPTEGLIELRSAKGAESNDFSRNSKIPHLLST